MLNTQKLLYILPDVAYLAELLPAKKEHTFTIQSFRQINGEFLDDNVFISENVQKLLGKIEADTYRLILPDFLFTNTIVEVKETQEAKVKAHIKEVLLPNLELTKATHEIETFILTQYNQASKVQLTAIERSVLDPIVVSAKENKIQISGISPLSWTIKSVVSLEPSVTVVQMGDMLYVAEHYIGVDQCTQSKVSEIENVVETIKTLKGAQPSIQTMYLLTNELVENQLKEVVSVVVPIQQLTSFKDEDTQMPSYVRQVIESGMKTFDIPDYPVPSFGLPKQPVGEVSIPAVADSDEDEEIETTSETSDKKSEKNDSDSDTDSTPIAPPTTLAAPPAIPMPASAEAKSDLKTEIVEPLEIDLDDDSDTPDIQTDKKDDKLAEGSEPIALEATDTVALPAPDEVAIAEKAESVKEETEEEKPLITPPSTDTTEEKPLSKGYFSEDTNKIETTASTTDSKSEPDLRQFAHENSGKIDMIETPPVVKDKPPVIKNKSGTGNMLKMIFITLAVFSATVAVGVAIGLGVLSWSNQGGTTEAPTEVTPSPLAQIEESPQPTASPDSTATASATINTEDTDVLVVNATTTAGYAGSTKTKLDNADYGTVRAANARGDYEPGTYVLMEEENPELIAALERVTGLELEFTTGYATEDPQGTYTAVIVLAE